MIGDGELNEGSIWESFLISKNWKLGNLIIVIDKNNFQANDKTNRVLNLGNLEKKTALWILQENSGCLADFSGFFLAVYFIEVKISFCFKNIIQSQFSLEIFCYQ